MIHNHLISLLELSVFVHQCFAVCLPFYSVLFAILLIILQFFNFLSAHVLPQFSNSINSSSQSDLGLLLQKRIDILSFKLIENKMPDFIVKLKGPVIKILSFELVEKGGKVRFHVKILSTANITSLALH